SSGVGRGQFLSTVNRRAVRGFPSIRHAAIRAWNAPRRAGPAAETRRGSRWCNPGTPSGTAFCIGVVLIVMMTGRLVQTKGSLARAVLPFVVHLRWGWHRVERAMERGKFSLDALFDLAADWCLRQVPVEPGRLGTAQRA